MLNFQFALPKDLRESALIEKKRQYEEQRKPRIFNAKQRLIGVSYHFTMMIYPFLIFFLKFL